MPRSSWIQNAELVPENRPYRVDASGRIIVPSHLRSKFNVNIGDCMAYYTTFIDNKWFICACLHTDEHGNKLDEKGNIIEYAPGNEPTETASEEEAQ